MNSKLIKTSEILSGICERDTSLPCYFTATIIFYIDYLTGEYIQFPILYVLPVGISACVGHNKTSYILACIMPIMRLFFIYLWNEPQLISFAIINTIITIVVLLFYAYLIQRTVRQTRMLEKRVNMLEGILPVCASCKKIMDEKGEYIQMEQYVLEHSEASFSHGICPECMCKLYPEFYNESDFDNTKS